MSRRRDQFLCHDCHRDTWQLGHSYIVHDELWAAAGLPEYGGTYLCLDCIEDRLGRPLAVEDFRLTDADTAPYWGDCSRMLPFVSRPRMRWLVRVLAAWRYLVRAANPAMGDVAAVGAYLQFWADHCRQRPAEPELLLDLYRHLDLVMEVGT
jgi:hypothetical protein